MASSVENKTLVVLGHARQSDAFQCGREAAQMAKNQLHSAPPALTLVFGPDNVRFKDLIEGARLVTGRDPLVGIPTQHALTQGISTSDSAIVLMIQSENQAYSIAGASTNDASAFRIESEIDSQFRKQHGNSRKSYAQKGRLLFSNAPAQKTPSLFQRVLNESATDTWGCGIAPAARHSAMVCDENTIEDGLIAIECLTQAAWGIGDITVSEFASQPGVHNEALRSAIRTALDHLNGNTASVGFLFLNFPFDAVPPTEFNSFFQTASQLLGPIPLVALTTQNQFFHQNDRAHLIDADSITVVLGPR